MALKPASVYGMLAATKAKCPPGSSQAKYYEDLADMVLTIIRDADINGLGLSTAPGGGPVTGLSKLV